MVTDSQSAGSGNPSQLFPSDTRELLKTAIPNPWWRITLYIGIWLIIGAMSGVVWHFSFTEGNPYTLPEIVWAKTDLWLIWGLFTIVILSLGYRFRIESPNRGRHTLFLLGCSLVFVPAYLFLYGLHVTLFLGRPLSWETALLRLDWALKNYGTYWYLVFWTTIAIEHVSGYYRRFVDREVQKSVLQKQLVEAQLETLKAQLHPHFLFNSLNTVAAMIEDNQPGKARETVNRLAELLRLSLEVSRSQFVSLEQEIAFIERYLHLIRERFADVLTVRVDIDPAARTARVPGLLLQPLVENAVKHGVALCEKACDITITARTHDTTLEVTVVNSIEVTVAAQSVPGTGTGLRNLRTRLEQLYSGEATITMDAAHPDEFRVTVRLPMTSRSQEGEPKRHGPAAPHSDR